MALMDEAAGWGLVSRVLHWGSAVTVVLAMATGLWLSDLSTSYGAARDAAPSDLLWAGTHHTLGLFVAIWTFLRVNWRVQNVHPQAPEGHSRLRHGLARLEQAVLLGLLFLLPLSGWAAVSTAAADLPMYFLGLEVPRMYEEPPGTSLVHDVAAVVHGWTWIVVAVLVGVHVAAALWTQFREGDPVIWRMWRGAPVESPSDPVQLP